MRESIRKQADILCDNSHRSYHFKKGVVYFEQSVIILKHSNVIGSTPTTHMPTIISPLPNVKNIFCLWRRCLGLYKLLVKLQATQAVMLSDGQPLCNSIPSQDSKLLYFEVPFHHEEEDGLGTKTSST